MKMIYISEMHSISFTLNTRKFAVPPNFHVLNALIKVPRIFGCLLQVDDGTMVKLDRAIHFPVEGLDMSPYVLSCSQIFVDDEGVCHNLDSYSIQLFNQLISEPQRA